MLAACLHIGTLWLATFWGPLAGLGALVIGFVAVWHLREQAVLPLERWLAGAWILGIAATYLAVLGWLRCQIRRTRLSLLGVGCGTVLVCALAISWTFSPTFRWQLLHFNTLIGTPLYYVLGDPVSETRERIRSEALREQPRADQQPAPRAFVSTTTSRETGPHIVFLLIDTLRADSLSHWGGDPDLMPRLNRLAAASTRFSRVSANAGWTRPSVASYFTGLLPEEHGAIDWKDRLSDAQLTTAELLAARGYQTAAFVSNWGAVGRDAGFAQGFEHFDELSEPDSPGYARAEFANAAVLDWLDGPERNPAQPLFLYVHYLDPHEPYLHGSGDPTSHRGAREGYESELRYLDEALGTFLPRLQQRLGNRTAVLVTSDHGEEFGEHGQLGHGHSLYREILDVPAFVWRPGSTGAILEAPLESRDFFALLLSLAVKLDLDLATWSDGAARGARYASLYVDNSRFTRFLRPYLDHSAIQTLERDGFRLIWSAYGDTRELYDHSSDPEERRNIARERPDVLQQLSRAMDEEVTTWARPEAANISSEALEMLRALGYVR